MKILINLTLMLFLSSSATANDKIAAPEIFTQMKSLVGTWQEEGATNSKFKISFELTARDTTLVETWIYEGRKHSLTIYHLNGNNLMATHYCPQGNQPRLQLTKGTTLNKFSFAYLDATNLESIEDSHQHSLGFDISELPAKILRKESYISKSKEKASEMILVRNK